MQLCQTKSEDTGGCDQDHNDGQGIHAVPKDSPYTLPVKPPVNKYADDQAVDNSDRGRLRCCKHTAHNAEHNDQHSGQSPEGHAQLFDKIDNAELLPLGIIALNRDDIGADHQ